MHSRIQVLTIRPVSDIEINSYLKWPVSINLTMLNGLLINLQAAMTSVDQIGRQITYYPYRNIYLSVPD